MTEEEWISSREMIIKTKAYMEKKHGPSAYNIGINVGSDAGQSVFHAHIHIIPRYSGDIENPGPQQKKVNMPLFEFMRDNELFKKIIYSQLVNRKLEQVIEKSNKSSLEEIKGDKVYLIELKKDLRKAVDDLCDDNNCEAYDRIIEAIELISIVNG
jgi:diadenosine tetraphosphate (Ap4A) HIT family hydrolase